ncbi:probable palmitoyltransferase ZDHHC12 [Sinocyclocheilus anshuiensis]|uniref:probable palmitoyltransferase ZDHHC12 n=1 Tax=Sinocyclocheilus anshuiensis TaxID=1608454 RepID=UPI0007B99D8B|nr:PREDICTED: probable palmitoyltransferase ZDHHC12 [Sinocyclocheilus anshuiensis]
MFKNVFGSGFLVRTAHVILTWVITLILFLHDTDLRRQEETGELTLPVLFVLLVLVSVLLYFAVSLMDPGFVLSDDCDLQVKTRIPPPSHYIYILQDVHTLVSAYVEGRVHKCGTGIQTPFKLVVLLWGLYMAWSGFSHAPTWQLWLRTNGVLLGAAAAVAVLSLTVLLLLGSHLYLVSLNTTTWEFMSRHRISYLKHCGADENPFDRGTLRNLWSFFCIWEPVVWEHVYFKQGNDTI